MAGYEKRNPSPFPIQRLEKVERPTTIIVEDEVQRVDGRENGFYKAAHGAYGPNIHRESGRDVAKHPLSGALWQIQGCLREFVDGLVAEYKAPLPNDAELLSGHIKEVAYFLRSDAVGICALPPYAVYSHSFPDGHPIELNHKYAIGILVDQDWRTSHASTGHDWVSNSMSFMSYSASGFIACILADYIRKLGYPARAHLSRNYEVVVPPILLWAGLGEMCRIGDCVLHPFLGPRFKAAVVTTDLPLVSDKPINFGLQDFCSKCKQCARLCPAGALSLGDKIMYNGYERWPTDIEKCTRMRVGNKRGAGCGTCIKVCPWNKPYTPFHRAIGWAVMHSSLARRFAMRVDNLLGYGMHRSANKWWFDLEDLSGVLRVPGAEKGGESQVKKGKDV